MNLGTEILNRNGGRGREKLRRDGRTGLHSGEETRWRHWDHKNDCCSKNRSAAVPPRDLLLVATRCRPETCCQPEGGSAARLFHWSQGHYPYGGSGWALSRGLLRSPGQNTPDRRARVPATRTLRSSGGEREKTKDRI